MSGVRKKNTARTTKTRFCTLRCNRRNYKKRERDAKVMTSEKETVEKRQIPIANLGAKAYLSINHGCEAARI